MENSLEILYLMRKYLDDVVHKSCDYYIYSDLIDFVDSVSEKVEQSINTKSCDECKFLYEALTIKNNIGNNIDICYMCSRQERKDKYEQKEKK